MSTDFLEKGTKIPVLSDLSTKSAPIKQSDKQTESQKQRKAKLLSKRDSPVRLKVNDTKIENSQANKIILRNRGIRNWNERDD